jgi:glycosyltransferase involved in cell wall biosynthesis
MACGRGGVAADAGALPELVSPDSGVLVPPRDAVALAEGIVEFYRRDPAAQGAAARARAEGEYGWDVAMRGLLGLYRAALASSACGTPRHATS